MTNNGIPLEIVAPLVVGVTTVVGLAAGYVRARFNVPSFVTSLALWSIYDGMKQVMSNNIPDPVENEAFAVWGRGELLGIPYVIIAGVLHLFRLHRQTNRLWTRGLRGGRQRESGLCGGHQRVVDASIGVCDHRRACRADRTAACVAPGTATGQVASGLEFSSIAAVVIGGTSLSGGRGTFIGSLIGVIFISVIGRC